MLSRSSLKTALWFQRTAICSARSQAAAHLLRVEPFTAELLKLLQRFFVVSRSCLCLTCISAETFPSVNLSFLHQMHVLVPDFYLPNQCTPLTSGAAQFGTTRNWPCPACSISQLALLSTIPPTPASFRSCHPAAWQDTSKSDSVTLWERRDMSSPASLLADRLAGSGSSSRIHLLGCPVGTAAISATCSELAKASIIVIIIIVIVIITRRILILWNLPT